jgi:diguanylate cyclase (GGDEF)-like protein
LSAGSELHAPQASDLIVISHDSGGDRLNDWLIRRKVGGRRDFARAKASPAEETDRRLAVSTRRLTQVLGRVEGLQGVCSVAVRHVARCVRSRFAAFAVPTGENELTIVATHGYPLELVRMLRIRSGSGIIGSVHASGTPMLVEDVATVPGLRRRPRYRTNSFMAVPVTAAGAVLGVICVADRLDDQPFTRDDLASLRALTAPVVLALARERARRDAEDFARAAIMDPVSGLFNRRYFHERLEEELDRARRHATTVALLMIDIDNFKGINDRYGHLAGDLVIRGVGDILKRSVRKFDLCTRFGGEEFAIVMPGSGPENSIPVAERIRQRIETFQPAENELADLRVTASIGMAVSRGASARELIARADQALYEAKQSGKNRLVEWKPSDDDRPGNPRNTR